VNFRRQVTVVNAKGIQMASGNISRVRMSRAGTTALAEDLTVNVFDDCAGT